jgi:Fur family zinc uptake transcriptional regulator
MHDGCDHAHSGGGGLRGEALSAALAAAEARCEADRQRLTAPRRRVLELLLEATGPVKAYDLIAGFGDSAAKPPTVYRALDFLEGQGLAHRLESLNAYIACRLGETPHAAAFLICDCCGATKEIEPAAAAAVREAAEHAGYSVNILTVEARGLCQACREA